MSWKHGADSILKEEVEFIVEQPTVKLCANVFHKIVHVVIPTLSVDAKRSASLD